MVEYLDYTSPSTQYTYDVNKSHLFIKDNKNYINILGINQLNTLENVSLLDIFLSTNNVIEPHYHQNAAQLVYCISGAVKSNTYIGPNQDCNRGPESMPHQYFNSQIPYHPQYLQYWG